MKKIFLTWLIFTITLSVNSQENGWDKTIVSFDKDGHRHGFYQVQDTLFTMYGFGIKFYPIDSTGIFSIEGLVLDGPAIKSNKLKIEDTIVGLRINNLYNNSCKVLTFTTSQSP